MDVLHVEVVSCDGVRNRVVGQHLKQEFKGYSYIRGRRKHLEAVMWKRKQLFFREAEAVNIK